MVSIFFALKQFMQRTNSMVGKAIRNQGAFSSWANHELIAFQQNSRIPNLGQNMFMAMIGNVLQVSSATDISVCQIIVEGCAHDFSRICSSN